MKRFRFRANLIVLGAVVVISSQLLPQASATSVEILPEIDSYLISGGAIHHSNFTKDRQEAATCSDCFWKIRVICKSWQDSSHGSCPWLRLQCPRDMQLVEVFRANSNSRPVINSGLWYFVGYSCVGDAGPISSIDITDTLARSWIVGVPKLRIKYFPANDAVLSHPLKFEVLSKNTFDEVRDIFGDELILHAKSRIEFKCNSSKYLGNCISQKSNQIKFKKTGFNYLHAKAIWSATYDFLGITGIEVQGTNPTSELTTLFNVHPLFTHLLN